MRRNEHGNWVVNYPMACFVVATLLIGLGTEFRWLIAILFLLYH